MKNNLLKNAKDTLTLGVATMGGSYALGALGNLPGMPDAAKTSMNTANAGLNLVNVGMLANTATGLFNTKTPVKKGAKSHSQIVKNILY